MWVHLNLISTVTKGRVKSRAEKKKFNYFKLHLLTRPLPVDMVAVSSNSQPLDAEVASLEIAQTTSIRKGRISSVTYESCETTHTNAPDSEGTELPCQRQLLATG